MHEHMTADELLDELPPAERIALEFEALQIADPSGAARAASACQPHLEHYDISD